MAVRMGNDGDVTVKVLIVIKYLMIESMNICGIFYSNEVLRNLKLG